VRSATKTLLRDFRAPDETAAEQRAWTAVRAAYLEREPVRAGGHAVRRLVLAPLMAVFVAGVLLSPAGATVRRFITRALGVSHAAPALSSLPSPGRILVSGPGGTWTAAADGSTRHLGPWQQASWSPHGLYVAVSSGDRLAAVDPHGDIRWAIARPGVSDESWFTPTGYRIAYLSAGTLRVIAGDGTDDHLLAASVAHVAPAWRPGHPYQLAYVTDRGSVVVRQADTGQLLWSTKAGITPRELLWSSDGSRLLVLSDYLARTYAANGRPRAWLGLPHGKRATDAALSPNGTMLALVLDANQLVIATMAPKPTTRQLLSGAGLRQVSWSPDGRWLLVSWPAADQWVFLRVAGAPRVAAVSRIAQQFSSPGSPARFPQLEGWCCTAAGTAG
jgi:WD40-like Beta Propeller Repeat